MSPSKMVMDLNRQVNIILRNFDLRKLSVKERDFLTKLQQNLADSRIYTRDYELSETREEQLDTAKIAKKWLEHARKNILAASESNIFGAIDVAHMSAIIDQIIFELK
jgi:predicted Holliday junction resolvase-like endonuclease